jgi:hypothetical protein
MDREADSYAFLVELASTNKRFVIRMASSKRQLADDAGTVADILTAATVVAEREVPLSTRGRSSLPSYRKLHPARQERIARLEIVSAAVTIKRPCSSNTSASKTLALNVVQVREPAPPEGEVPVEWRLWTTEPVATREQALAVVDAYRGRWRIEEYFKALKQGCAIEKRQLESHDGLVNTLALMVPIAWRLLCLRTFAHAAAALPATAVLSPRQVHCLRAALIKRKRPPLPKSPTVRDALFGIAGLGGHIKNNGDPGWMVLGRGFDDLLMIELGYMLAVEDGEM